MQGRRGLRRDLDLLFSLLKSVFEI